jgi:hypothetical protein
MRDNLTTDGYAFEVLAEEIGREVLSVGRYGILVDFATYGNTSNQLPHFATYFAEDIINWAQQFIKGRKVLTRLVLRDDIDNTSGQDTVRYLELILNESGQYEVRKWEAQVTQQTSAGAVGSKLEFIMTKAVVPLINGKHLDRIPFVFFNPYDMRPDIEKPPFLDLVNMNLSHYRNSADYEHALYLTAQPTPWISGQLDEANKPKAIGSGTIWYLPQEAQAGMLEFTGAGIGAQQKALEDKENRMAALGARMISDSAKAAETAETAKIRGKGETSLLTNVVSSTQMGLERCFRIAAEWVNINPDEVVVKINRDFIETRLSAQELDSLVKSWMSGAISRQTMHENLQSGEIINPERTVDDERDAIDDEGGGLFNQAAEAAAAAVAAEKERAAKDEGEEKAAGTE